MAHMAKWTKAHHPAAAGLWMATDPAGVQHERAHLSQGRTNGFHNDTTAALWDRSPAARRPGSTPLGTWFNKSGRLKFATRVVAEACGMKHPRAAALRTVLGNWRARFGPYFAHPEVRTFLD